MPLFNRVVRLMQPYNASTEIEAWDHRWANNHEFPEIIQLRKFIIDGIDLGGDDSNEDLSLMDVSIRMREYCKQKYSSGKRFVVALLAGHIEGKLSVSFSFVLSVVELQTSLNVFKMMRETFD